jgi:hypothetical protein
MDMNVFDEGGGRDVASHPLECSRPKVREGGAFFKILRREDRPTTRPTGLPTRFFLGAGRGSLQSLCSISQDFRLQAACLMSAAAPEALLTRWQRDGPDIVSSASISHRLISPSHALRQNRE